MHDCLNICFFTAAQQAELFDHLARHGEHYPIDAYAKEPKKD